MISKLTCIAVFITLLALLACGGGDAPDAQSSRAAEEPTATASPTPTPEPTNTPEPTSTPEPTATPVPPPTEAPVPPPTEAPDPAGTTGNTGTGDPAAPTTGEADEMGPLTPLRLTDPMTAAAELSETELVCLAGTADMARLMEIFSAPDLATPEEQGKIFNCLGDESLLRIFLTDIIDAAGSLSLETSMCIRSGMEGVDLAAAMRAGTAGDEQTAMVGSMSAFIVTMSCLNEDEWQAAAPLLGAQPGERENLQCVMEKLGGPEGMAATLAAGDESSIMTFFGAVGECGLQMGGPPAG